MNRKTEHILKQEDGVFIHQGHLSDLLWSNFTSPFNIHIIAQIPQHPCFSPSLEGFWAWSESQTLWNSSSNLGHVQALISGPCFINLFDFISNSSFKIFLQFYLMINFSTSALKWLYGIWCNLTIPLEFRWYTKATCCCCSLQDSCQMYRCWELNPFSCVRAN